MSGSGEVGLGPEQIESIWHEHATGLRRFLLGVLKDGHLADEALQQSFVKTIQQGHTADPARMKGWIYKVAFNEAMEQKRRQKTAEGAKPKLADALRAKKTGRSPQEQVAWNEQVEAAQHAMARLPAEQKMILTMRLQQSKTFAQIADELDIPLGTALTRMRLALQKLKLELGP